MNRQDWGVHIYAELCIYMTKILYPMFLDDMTRICKYRDSTTIQ